MSSEQQGEQKKDGFYQRLYRDIIKGYTSFDFQNKKVYIKHLGNLDLGDIQEEDQKLFDKAKKEGLLTEEDKVKLLIEQGIWSQKEEDHTNALKQEIAALQDSIKKLIVQAQIRQYRRRLEEKESDLAKFADERAELVGFTCEKYVTKHISREYLKYSLFSNVELTEFFLTDEIYDDITDSDLDTITLIYNLLMQESSSENIKKIAAYPWFLNTFMLCNNNTNNFFGEPIIKLSNYQIELFTHATRYKSVLDQGKSPPQSLYDDIQLVVDWYEGMLDEKIIAKSAEADGGTVFGASGKEMRNFANVHSKDGREVVDLASEVGKTGKQRLGMKELLDIHGH
tara:strand:- start:9052 stop:10071 length:1020 start_codon:yes stop_codon:yes gene_type:complete